MFVLVSYFFSFRHWVVCPLIYGFWLTFGISKLFFKPWWLIPSKQQNGPGLRDAHISGFSGVYVAQSFFFLCVVFCQHFFYCFPFPLFLLAIVLFVFHYYGLRLPLCYLQTIHNIFQLSIFLFTSSQSKDHV